MDLSPYADTSLFSHRYFIYSPSWQCNAACRHCFIPISKRRWGKFERRVLHTAVDTAPEDVRIIGITGGEPFDHIRRLYEVLGVIAKSNRITTVVTNGLWSSRTDSIKVLKKTVELGLAGIAVSLDDYHRPKIKLADLYKLLKAARELGLAVNIKSVGNSSGALLEKLKATGVMNGQEKAFSSFDLERTGHACTLDRDGNESEIHQCLGAMEPMVVPDGKVYACCSPRIFSFTTPPLVIGDVLMEPLKEILARASKSYLLAAIVSLGPGGILEAVGESIPTDLETRCALCSSIMTDPVFVEHFGDRLRIDKELRKEITGRLLVYESWYRPEFLPQIQEILSKMESARGKKQI